jgi:hypothetical protein
MLTLVGKHGRGQRERSLEFNPSGYMSVQGAILLSSREIKLRTSREQRLKACGTKNTAGKAPAPRVALVGEALASPKGERLGPAPVLVLFSGAGTALQ